MRFAEPLFLSDSVRAYEPRRLRVKGHPAHLDPYYVLTVSKDSPGLFSYYPPKQLKKPYYETSDDLVIGLAFTEEEAKALSVRILNATFQARGDYDVRSYFEGAGSAS